MLVNTQRDTDIVSVSNRTEPEEEKESRTREKALERNKKKLQEKKEAVTEYPDTAGLHTGVFWNPDTVHMTNQNPDTSEKSQEESGNPDTAISMNKKILSKSQSTKGNLQNRTGFTEAAKKTAKRNPTDKILCVNAKATGAVKDSVTDLVSFSDAEYAGNKNRSDSDPDYAGMSVIRRSAKAVSGFIMKEVLVLVKMIAGAVGKMVLVSIGAAIIVVTLAAGIIHSVSGTEDEVGEAAAQYEYHSYNQHNYTGQANKACGVTAAASALRSLGLQITPDMLEQHNNNHVGLWYGADAWVNNHYPVQINRGTVSADTIDQALQHGSLCVVYLHNNCDVSSGSSQWNTGRNVSGGGCHWITLIGYTEAGLIAALDPADGTGNEEYCSAENCEGGTTSKAISMDEVMESCSNIYVITPTETRTDNEKLLAALIYSEAGASYEDKLAVGTVVMNRLDMQYGGALTLEDVIYAPNQFAGTNTDNFRNALQNGAPAQCQQVAYEILQGKRSDKIPSSCVSFMALSISESEMRRRTGCTNFIIIDQRFGW